jgi:hypothetical protein
MRDYRPPDVVVPDPEDRMTPAEAALYLGVTVQTLRGWRSKRCGPPFFQPTRYAIFYARADLREWLMQRRVRPRA